MSDPRLPDLFAEAVELEADARAAWLDRLRRRDTALALEVEGLLDAMSAGERRFEAPPRIAPAAGPTALGPYRIVREVGHGGMGRVFLAEQDGAEFRRTVALKMIDRPGYEANVRRFRDEVRILASLEHPGIARFLDGGRTPDGTWFLALEYVAGQHLGDFVRERGLDLRQRVELFLQVLDAVDFAHRHLIVHRDLKPRNVLVDADGRTKLLDFGISKILDPESAADATRTEMRALTPAYASPEQLRGESVSTASDVYSLGVILYELLASRRPFGDRGAPASAAHDRHARDAEPPSTAARQESVRGGEISTLVRWRDLTGDLDAITLKALRAAPESRYRSAAALADDLRRWLRGEPVEARRGGRRYRVGKFVARHRLAIIVAAALVVAVGAGLFAALVQRSRALAAQTRAEATVGELHRLTQSMLFRIYDEARQLPNSLPLGSEIVRSATEVLDRLAASAGDDPRLLGDLATGYERLGQLFTHHPALQRSLNRPQAALDFYRRAVAIRRTLAAESDAGFAARLAWAKSLGGLAAAQMNAGDAAAAGESSEETIRILSALEANSPDPGLVRFWLALEHSQAWRRAQRARRPAAVAQHAAASAKHWLAFLEAPSDAALAEPALASQGGKLGTALLFHAGHLEPALRLNDLALAALDRGIGGRPEGWPGATARAAVLSGRIDVLRALDRKTEALATFKEMRRVRAALPTDAEGRLNSLITDFLETQDGATLAAEAGDFEFAASTLALAGRYLQEAENHSGPAAFGSARVELEWSRAGIYALRAAAAPAAAERRRLGELALGAYRAALERAASLGESGHVHGMSPDRLDQLRRETASFEAKLNDPRWRRAG